MDQDRPTNDESFWALWIAVLAVALAVIANSRIDELVARLPKFYP